MVSHAQMPYIVAVGSEAASLPWPSCCLWTGAARPGGLAATPPRPRPAAVVVWLGLLLSAFFQNFRRSCHDGYRCNEEGNNYLYSRLLVVCDVWMIKGWYCNTNNALWTKPRSNQAGTYDKTMLPKNKTLKPCSDSVPRVLLELASASNNNLKSRLPYVVHGGALHLQLFILWHKYSQSATILCAFFQGLIFGHFVEQAFAKILAT